MATYNINKFAYNGNIYNLVPDINNIPLASLTSNGVVSAAETGTQNFLGIKRFVRKSRYTAICFGPQHAQNWGADDYGPASIVVDFGSSTNVQGNRFWFIQYSPTAATGQKTFTGNREIYKLPWCDNGMTTSKEYDIITSKTSFIPDTFKTYMGHLISESYEAPVILYNGTLSSGSVDIPNANLYNCLLIGGSLGTSEPYPFVLIPNVFYNSSQPFQINNENNYASFTLQKNGDSVRMAYKNRSNSDCAVKWVYGIGLRSNHTTG